MPLPLAMMIPFMGIQSAVMAKQFGENFQYGKRRISAMDNKEFNALTPKRLQDNANLELKSMIPSMESAVVEMREFQTFLIREFIKMINDASGAGFGALFGFQNPFETGGGETTPPSQEFGTNPNVPLINVLAEEIRTWSETKLFDIFANKLNLYDVPSQQRITTFYNLRINTEKPGGNIDPINQITYASKDEAMIGFLKTQHKQGKLSSVVHNDLVAFSRQSTSGAFKKVLSYLASEWKAAKNKYNITKDASAQKAVRKSWWDAITLKIEEINTFMGFVNF